MTTKLTNCPVCDTSNWQDLDYLRNTNYWYDKEFLTKEDEKLNFKICKECGFVTYDYPDDVELERRYELDRNIINFNHIVTGNRKIEYHKAFLNDLLDKNWFKDKSFVDYGCAIGLWLDFLFKINHEYCQGIGIELNKISANFGRKEYNLNIVDNMPDEKFDFITCYHVLEHLKNPDKVLAEFKEHLSDDGYLYIAVPENFGNELDEASGLTTVDFENFYHLNHLSFFSKISLQNLIKKAGFKIVKENDKYYGYTVLCQKDYDNTLTKQIVKQDYQKIVTIIENQKKAIELVQEKPDEALAIMPGFVDAHIIKAMKAFKDLKKQEEILLEAMKATNNHYKIKRQLGILYFQWSENMAGEHKLTNHIRRSKEIFEELIIEKPGMEDYYYYLAIIAMKYYKEYDKAREYYGKIIEINPAKYGEITNLVGLLWKDSLDK
jgi:SAM-dependent methyltransferase